MSPQRRRSSRLNGGNKATPAKHQNMKGLSSVFERDESPGVGATPSLDAIVSSPIARPNFVAGGQNSQYQSSVMRTPPAGRDLYPSLDEMHPSKVQQSTTKQPDSGLRFGFIDAGAKTAPPKSGNEITFPQNTPTKMKGFFSKLPSSSSFNFTSHHPDAELSPEAKRMMGEVREVASSVKEKLVAQRERERQEGGGASHDLFGAGGRKLATPKGKAGRFSDVHMAEFKRMDSIAGHPSAYRAQPGRSETVTKSLKRTKSQAKLDDTDTTISGSTSPKSPDKRVRGGANAEKQSPMKRTKQDAKDDASSARPISRDGKDSNTQQTTPSISRSKSGVFSSITTPTKASLARSASAKSVKTSQLPLPRTPSSRRLLSGIRTEGNNKYLSSLARFGNVKSILRRPEQASTSEAEGPEVTTPTTTTNHHFMSPTKTTKVPVKFEKELPSLPETPKTGIYRFPSMKQASFTPNGTEKALPAHPSPSPVKTAAVPSNPPKPATPDVVYPILPGVPAIEPESPPKPRRSTPGDFTFRAEKSIKFGPPATSGATIRQVRPSIGPGSTAFPDTPRPLPTIAHGMSNKKRHRQDSDSENEENHEPQAKKQKGGWGATETANSPSPRKQTINNKPGQSRRSMSPAKKRGRNATAGGKSPGFLSMSRLNALARPKKK